MSKPSPAMLHVLQRLTEGWQLARSGGYAAGAWMQEGKIGYGGESESVKQVTFFALYHRGYLKLASRGAQRAYTISEAGKAVLGAQQGKDQP